MVEPFKETTLNLLRALDIDPDGIRRQRPHVDETGHIWSALHALNDRFYKALGSDAYSNGYWPIDSRMMGLLKAALEENRGNYLAKDLARMLVRGGCHEPDVMASLHAWERMMFTWKQAGISVESAIAILRQSGLIESLPDAFVEWSVREDSPAEALNGWLHNPVSALDQSMEIVHALFGDSLVYASLKDDEVPHHEHLGELLAKCRPPVEVENLRQSTDVVGPERFVQQVMPVAISGNGDLGRQLARLGVPYLEDTAEHYIVSFTFQGRPYLFTAENWGRRPDLDSVLRFFDRFMAELGRRERAFDLKADPNDEHAFLIVADPAGLTPVVQSLHIPFTSAPPGPDPTGSSPPATAEPTQAAASLCYADGAPVRVGDAVLFGGGLWADRVMGFLPSGDQPKQVVMEDGPKGNLRVLSAEEVSSGRVVLVKRDSQDPVRDCLSWLDQRASEGLASAQFARGNLHLSGLYEPRDDAKGVLLWQQAAAQNEPRALHGVGNLYRYGRHGVQADAAKAADCFRRSAAQGYAPGEYALGWAFLDGHGVPQDDAQGAFWLRKSAEQGNPAAQNNLAALYSMGRGVAKSPTEALAWSRRAAEQGNAQGQYDLGRHYATGVGIERDDKQAVRYYELSAAQGYGDALCNLGYMVAQGRGVAADIQRAATLYRSAAEKNNSQAMFNLGQLCLNKMVPPDRAGALGWFERAAALGHAGAIKALSDLRDAEKAHTADTIAETRQRWRARSEHLNTLRVDAPAWMTQKDRLLPIVSRQMQLLEQGRIVWAALVQANNLLFSPGKDDHPGLLVYSTDSHFDAHPEELRRIAGVLAGLKNTAPAEPELRRFADMITNELERALAWPVPAQISTRPVFCSAFLGFRRHLPGGFLGGNLFPLLIHPATEAVMVLPGAYWPPALLKTWRASERKAEPESSAPTVAQQAMAAYKSGDYANALKLFTIAAEAGEPGPAVMLSDMYRHGKGAPENLATALGWARHAADLGHARGQALVAVFYLKGLSVPQDLEKARHWLRKAADQGYEPARETLASLLKGS